MSKVYKWGVDLYKKSNLPLEINIKPVDKYMPFTDQNHDNVIIGACIRMVAEGQSPIEVSFDADVLTGQQVLGQWSYDIDGDGNPVIEKRKYRVLTMRVEFEEID